MQSLWGDENIFFIWAILNDYETLHHVFGFTGGGGADSSFMKTPIEMGLIVLGEGKAEAEKLLSWPIG